MGNCALRNPNGRLPAPWLDLPDDLINLILERLSLAGYIRFAAVCKKWQSIQRSHRLRRRLVPGWRLPWILAIRCGPLHVQESICRSGGPQQRYLSFCRGRFLTITYHGFCLLVEGSESCFIVCPAYHLKLQLRPLPRSKTCLDDVVVAAVSSRSDPLPHFILLGTDVELFLYTGRWTPLPFPDAGMRVESAASCQGKFYCSCFVTRDLLVINPVSSAFEHIKMDNCASMIAEASNFLVECNGYLLLVEMEMIDTAKKFKVYRADLRAKTWVPTQRIGNQALVFDQKCCFSLVASDVGGNPNCIYYSEEEKGKSVASKEFDMESGKVSDMCTRMDNMLHPILCPSCWVLPSLEDKSFIN